LINYFDFQRLRFFKQLERFGQIRTWCEDCGREVSLVPPAEAALLTFQEPDAIYSLIDEKKVHFRFFGEKTPFICLTSLCLI
jgi:hypothetical protein